MHTETRREGYSVGTVFLSLL